MKNYSGILGITDNIIIKNSEDQVEKTAIERALRRNWFIEDSGIKVDVSNHEVKLTGSVESWDERHRAERMAWNAAGVRSVETDLVVEYL